MNARRTGRRPVERWPRWIFVSYCHEDDAWLKRLKVHLRPLIRQGVVDVRDDTRISPGLTWQEEITNALSRARVAVLLVSADFLASDFLVDTEIPALLHRAADGGVLILPVVVGPACFKNTRSCLGISLSTDYDIRVKPRSGDRAHWMVRRVEQEGGRGR